MATNDTYTTPQNTTLTVAAPGVLANDSDPSGKPLTAALVAGPANGTLTLNPNGSFSYTPKAGFYGADSFTYRDSDGTLQSNTATVALTVTQQPPVAANDTYTTPENTTLTVAAPGVLANDSDPSGKPLTAALVAGPANGTLTLNSNGSFSYTPKAGFSGADSFTYRDSDGTLLSNTATVALTVTTSTSTGATIWSSSATPTNPDNGPDSAVTLGVKFESNISGYITGIRFYKGSGNTGKHVGSLWSSTGTLLATATFKSETGSGWQQVNFSTRVAITANTVYVASYHTNVGHYAADRNYFATSGVVNAPLQALANGVSGSDGVYNYGSTSRLPHQRLHGEQLLGRCGLPTQHRGRYTDRGHGRPHGQWGYGAGQHWPGAGTTAPTIFSTASAIPLTADPKSVPAGPMALAKSRPGPITSQQTRYHSRPPVKQVIPSTKLMPTWRSLLST